ncbi:AI-2E family transporter [Thiopseudomonas acetoxidans]|uniref:AI-2E family transporter n=1 Tax=Thiopseudomonas acetoxidans TaxID=3041622 RepID=A0ABT7SRB6_9GAMM|nr:AI-2E family transporter [Thiopseudomonas sp. CY1220]MDM7858736.1 AI-2E family transporter [Thiopseudomonas sp. CY1220]
MIVAALFVVLAGLKVAANILVPFLLSSFIAIICYPLVKKVESFKVPKPLAIVGVVLVVVTVAVFMVSLVGKSLLELSQMLPIYLEALRGEINWVVDKRLVVIR